MNPNTDPEKLEAEANAIIEQMMKMRQQPESRPDPNQGLENSDDSNDNEQRAEPETDSSAQEKETPAPADTDSQAGDESGVSEPETDWEKKLRVAEERVKNTQSRMHKATQEAAELRKQNQKLLARLDEIEAQLKEKAEADPDVSSLMEDYPDIAKPLLQKISKLEKRLEETSRTFQEDSEKALLDAHFKAVRAAHPDFDEVVTSDDFNGWLERQTPVWQRVATSGTADEVVELLSRYKEVLTPRRPDPKTVAEPKVPRSRKQDMSSGDGKKKIWTRAEIQALPLDEFERLEKEIDLAMVEGRIR